MPASRTWTVTRRSRGAAGRAPGRILRIDGGGGKRPLAASVPPARPGEPPARVRLLGAARALVALLLATVVALVAPAAAAAQGPGAARAPEAAQDPAASGLGAAAREWVEETLASLTLEQKAAQLVTVWTLGGYASTSSAEFRRLARLVDLGVGGLVISVGLPHEYAARLNALQERARVPLLVAADFESGGPSFRMGGIYALPYVLDLGGGTELPPTMAFGAIDEERFALRLGRITGLEARAVGVHLLLAPVLDVNSDPENPIINTRSFGEDPQRVARLGVAFIRGARSAGALTAGKHFPGHGDTRADSHLDLPAVDADRARLDAVELVPFRAAVEAGVDAILTAHVAVPGVLGPDPPPATLSPYFLTGLLREEWGFEGLIYTEAMDMGAVVNRYGARDAALRALEAGADVILMPPDPAGTVAAIAEAVRSGRISEARLDASVRRLLEAKAAAGLHRERRVEVGRVSEVVASRAHQAFADSAAARSLVLARDREGLVPLSRAPLSGPTPPDSLQQGAPPPEAPPPDAPPAGLSGLRALSVTFARREDLAAGRAFDRLLAPAVGRLERARLDYGSAPAAYDSARAKARASDLVVVGAYVSPLEASGTISLPEGMVRLVEDVRAAGVPLVVVSFGNPYLLDLFPEIGTYLLAWGGREVSQRAAARALLDRAPIEARLPISLPPHHRRGGGRVRPP